MINYRIHYAEGSSPKERHIKGARDVLARHVDEQVIPRPIDIFEETFRYTVRAINQLRKTTGSDVTSNTYDYTRFSDLKGLLRKIVRLLEKLEPMISHNNSLQNINKDVIAELKKCKILKASILSQL